MAIEVRYWDSACFLAVLLDEPNATKCEGVMQAASDGRVKIVTSTWTLTEVVHLKSGKHLAASDDRKIQDFFDHDFVVPRPVTEAIGHHARRLVWERRYSRRDAIHVATALDAKCPVFDTFDEKLRQAGPPKDCDLRFSEPDLPFVPTLLDDF